ncbi:MAG: tungsten formylmethanofuran dehydrogenase [Chloroflexi bacterium]|nr:tungsten formylmethanofuran dehydrogenase [Chloroflexota bacterium]
MPQVVVNGQNCKACYYCKELCPENVFAISQEINGGGYFPAVVSNGDACNSCMICYFICPDFAIGVEK